jgi:type I restriction enzyme M protein
VLSPGFWSHLDISRLDEIQDTFAPLMRFRQSDRGEMIALNLPDQIARRRWIIYGPSGEGAFADSYREQVEAQVRRLVENLPALIKLKRGEELNEADLNDIARALNQADLFITEDVLREVYQQPAASLPEGVLFGSTEAHIRLRRELLTEHLVEAIISLPAGVFQPYIGVKTSILVFQKETRKEDRDKWKPVNAPRTQSVWFYEVTEEAYTLDAKRTERRGQNNDLWDALEKFQTRYDPAADALVYYQPSYEPQRWRMVDQRTLEVFAGEPEVLRSKDRVAAIHELFADLSADPQEAQQLIEQREQPALRQLALACLNDAAQEAKATIDLPHERSERLEYAQALLRKDAARFRTPCNQQRHLLFEEESVAWPLFQKSFHIALDWAIDNLAEQVVNEDAIETVDYDATTFANEVRRVARNFAKLDGYDVMLRTLHVNKYARNDDWQSEDGQIKGSHDEHDNVRPEYVASITLYDEKGNLKEGLLDPDCIEARGWNLSTGQYKPFTFSTVQSDKSVADMLRELQEKEQQIIVGIDKLLAMVEGRE